MRGWTDVLGRQRRSMIDRVDGSGKDDELPIWSTMKSEPPACHTTMHHLCLLLHICSGLKGFRRRQDPHEGKRSRSASHAEAAAILKKDGLERQARAVSRNANQVEKGATDIGHPGR